MNPLVWLFVVAPAAAVAALLFVWVYQEQTDRGELQREQSRLERQEFDRDFAAAWNGDELKGPEGSDLEKTRARVASLEARRDAKEQEQCKRLAALAGELEGVVMAEKGTPDNCQQEQHQ
ncbi:hypothetical protein D3C85_812770 [compost metagenome]